MTSTTAEEPFGAQPTEGIVHRASPFGVDETIERLTGAIAAAGAVLFALVDHSGGAQAVGLSLRDTKLLIFGNPSVGTPAMQAAPLAALDLPLKVLVWEDDAGVVWMSYLSGSWLADRHGIHGDAAKVLDAPAMLSAHVAGNERG